MWRFSLILVCLMVLPSAAYGQLTAWKPNTCKSQSAAEHILQGQYKEKATAGGVTNGNALAELWRAGESTWTIIMRLPDGSMCLMLSGEGWRDYEMEVEGEVL